ncbi:MAG: DEAD/DEAH box helicase [Rubrivivax sp.]|nr:DEAD/DEAH box helicase [Rubrivivax sp.]
MRSADREDVAAQGDAGVAPGLDAAIERWFAARGQRPHDFQREVWAAMRAGESGLLHATTGSGKTLAVWLGALARCGSLLRLPDHGADQAAAAPEVHGHRPAPRPGPGLQVLWLTPMRALAADTTRALAEPLAALQPTLPASFTVAQRTGDTPTAERARQDRRPPTALVTTPESLTLMLTRENARADLQGVHTVIVDEWHELIGNKRGVQVQLALARLRRWHPQLVVWGLSATLGNLEEAMATLVGTGSARRDEGAAEPGRTPAPAQPPATAAPRLVRGRLDKTLVVDTLLPHEPGRFSWGGHLGAQMLPAVVQALAEGEGTALVFTNVRSQAEIWYQLILAARPDWAGLVALHHGSLDRSVREWVEAGLKAGTLKAVVATSSLDLGVDFLPVARVLQIGSTKGVARLLQRAGRSGHAPGRPSRITLVPTNTLELVEAVAARRAALAGQVESRTSPDKPLDVLVQHLVTVALGGGFTADAKVGGGFTADAKVGGGFTADAKAGGGFTADASAGGGFTSDELFDEVRTAPAYATLTREEFNWALAFVECGGESLGAYPEYQRVKLVDGVYRVPDRGIALRHRLQVGTIVGEASMLVKWASAGAGGGATLGTIEEGFIARLKAGDHFVFGGRVLEFVRVRDLVAYVRRPTGKARGIVPAWAGSRMPFSSELADAVLAVLDGVEQGDLFDPELQAARAMLEAQRRVSRLPGRGQLLVESLASREGSHFFFYPFAGRNVHLGLAQLLAWRLSRRVPNTFSLAINDYGLEVLAAKPVELDDAALAALFEPRDLDSDVLASLNSGELAQRRFREIARVAGLVFSGYPGAPKSARQLQASSSLFFEVFRKYDRGNRLLGQAEAEVLAQELELGRLRATLKRMAALPLARVQLRSASPFALPLMVERLREQLTTERLKDRLERLLAEAEAAAAEGADGGRAATRPRRRGGAGTAASSRTNEDRADEPPAP